MPGCALVFVCWSGNSAWLFSDTLAQDIERGGGKVERKPGRTRDVGSFF